MILLAGTKTDEISRGFDGVIMLKPFHGLLSEV